MDNIPFTSKLSERKRPCESVSMKLINHMSVLRHKTKELHNLNKEKRDLRYSYTTTRKNMLETQVKVLNNMDQEDNVRNLYIEMYNRYKDEVDTDKKELDDIEEDIKCVKAEVLDLKLKSDQLQSPMSKDNPINLLK